MIEIIAIAFFWIAFAMIVAVAANTRGRIGIGWFILALVISPLIAGLLVIALPDRRKSQKIVTDVWNARQCPFCAEVVQREASVCKHCGRDLSPAPARSWGTLLIRHRRDVAALIFAVILISGIVYLIYK